MSTLRILNIAGAPITDEGLTHLGQMSNLVELSLGACLEISDEGLSKLAGLKSLTYLDLMDASVDGSGLLNLTGLTALELVEFTAEQFKAPKSIIKTFNEALPKCEVSLVQG